MEIIVGKTSGFCAGVEYTVKKAYEALDKEEKVYCLGEIVHNERVVEDLSSKGMIFTNSLDDVPEGSALIVRAHGETREVYEEISNKNLKLIDLTCGKIRIIRNKIKSEDETAFIVMIGKKKHPETLGTISFCNEGMIFEEETDLKELKEQLLRTNKKRIVILSQTTFNEELFNKFSSLIKEYFQEYEVNIFNTICNATHERQEETKKIAQEVDGMIIIGGKNSSNTKELFNIAQNFCKQSFLVQDANDLDSIFDGKNSIMNLFNSTKKVGIMAGASTTQEAITEVVSKINYIKEDFL